MGDVAVVSKQAKFFLQPIKGLGYMGSKMGSPGETRVALNTALHYRACYDKGQEFEYGACGTSPGGRNL